MATTFKYKLINNDGLANIGFVTATDQEEALRTLQKEGVVVYIKESKLRDGLVPLLAPKRRYRNSVTYSDLKTLCNQFSVLLKANIPLLRAVDVLINQVTSRPLHKALLGIRLDIEAGASLSNAMTKYPNIFPVLWVNLIRVGERSGRLPFTFSKLYEYLDSTDNIRKQVINASIYPAIVLVVAIMAITIILIWFVPIFTRLFEQFHVELPLLTQIVIKTSDAFKKNFPLITLGITALFFGLKFYQKTPFGKWNIDLLKFIFPLTGNIYKEMIIEKISLILSVLLESGVSLLLAFDTLIEYFDNIVVVSMLKEVREEIKLGNTTSQAMKRLVFLPPMVYQMISVGEESGTLGPMFVEINQFFKESIETSLKRMASLFEPLMIIVTGGIVGIIVSSIWLPIFQLTQIGGR